MRVRRFHIVALSLLLGGAGCGASAGNVSPGSGGATGNPGTGGAPGQGGTNSSSSGTGGATNAGGRTGTGGAASGGAAGAGGMSGSGGASSGGGATGKGGTTGLGGANGSGGASGSGDSGAGGNATGGTTANTGGKVGATGGTTTSGTGGGQTGGTQSTGGATSPGAGGTSAASTALVTSASGAYWKTATWTEVTSGTADVTVNDTSASQTWEGFGGAFNEKGWSYLTTKDMQDQAMQLLFGTDGAHFAWGRIPIGASDYAMDRYTLDETANDTSMASFSIDRDQQKLIPYIKAAQAVKSDIRFWASPWTPPTWMKTGPYNPNTGKSNSNFDGGVMKSDDATLKAYGQYLVKFVQAYADQGINVEIVSPQNEPNYQQNYPSCHWETATYVKFVGSYLGPALAAANLTTKIMDGTLSNPSGDADIGSSVLKDSTAKGYCKAIGVQWGMAATNQITTLKDLAGDISIWLSETQCGGTTGSTAPAPNDFSYGHDTWGYITSAIKNGLTAYNAWNMVLDKGGLGIDDTRKWPQNALLVADSGSITQTPAYYVFRHISQFVDPGAKVVGTTGGDAVAFKNPDGTLVAVMYNSGSAKSTFTVAMGGKKLQFSMPASGWATVKNE